MSPSTLGFMAKIISLNALFLILTTNSFILNDSGSILSNGEIKPPST